MSLPSISKDSSKSLSPRSQVCLRHLLTLVGHLLVQWACSSALSGMGARGKERTRETTARQGVGTMQRSSLLLPVDVVRRTALPDRAHGRGHMGARLQNLCARGWPGHPSNFHFMQRLWGVPQRQELKKASKRSRKEMTSQRETYTRGQRPLKKSHPQREPQDFKKPKALMGRGETVRGGSLPFPTDHPRPELRSQGVQKEEKKNMFSTELTWIFNN